MNSTPRPAIVWFRHDLRTADHGALIAAAQSGAPLLPLYILDDEMPGPQRIGGASRWWLHESLKSLDARFGEHGGSLVLRKGPTPDVLAELLNETHAAAIHAIRSFEPAGTQNEEAVAALCQRKRVDFELHGGRLLFKPEAIRTKGGTRYRVFTPFWKACLTHPAPRAPLGVPRLGAFATCRSEPLDGLRLLPLEFDWTAGLRQAWAPGEDEAQGKLLRFIDARLGSYAETRDQLQGAPTSLLSPHLHFGEISPAQVWHAVRHKQASSNSSRHSAETFLKELGWREFSTHLLHWFPHMAEQPLRPEFARFPWRRNEVALSAWQRGQTGYPVVDAAMRQLWQTGWMPNRARMLVASFLVKHLGVPWQDGAAWFWDTLVDADLANNSASWQWVAGCGTDAAPYFRIFNPVLQGQKFDPNGDYVRAFVPDLAELPARAIHAPWQAPETALTQAGVELGKNYPRPIVDHDAARQQALEAFETIRDR